MTMISQIKAKTQNNSQYMMRVDKGLNVKFKDVWGIWVMVLYRQSSLFGTLTYIYILNCA